MRIGVAKETAPGERRVALVPDVVSRLTGSGFDVLVEKGAGEAAAFPDAAYSEAGASLVDGVLGQAEGIVKVQKPSAEEAGKLRQGDVLIGFLEPLTDQEGVRRLADAGVVAFAMESIPRITRAQPMDALSSQATVSGYKGALLAAERLPKFFPMLTTAAGTVPPAKVLVLGAGVAGLQAIATARRLGAVVSGFDVRPVVKEQVESLGASFLDLGIRGEETAGGYARRADARAAGAAAGRAREAPARLRRRDHDGRDPRPARAEADPRLGRPRDAAGLRDRRPRGRDRRQLRADEAGRGDGRERRPHRRAHEPARARCRRTRASSTRATSSRCSPISRPKASSSSTSRTRSPPAPA